MTGSQVLQKAAYGCNRSKRQTSKRGHFRVFSVFRGNGSILPFRRELSLIAHLRLLPAKHAKNAKIYDRIASIAKKRLTAVIDQNVKHPNEVLKHGHFRVFSVFRGNGSILPFRREFSLIAHLRLLPAKHAKNAKIYDRIASIAKKRLTAVIVQNVKHQNEVLKHGHFRVFSVFRGNGSILPFRRELSLIAH